LSQLSGRGLPLRFHENERIALDIDEPRDLAQFLSFKDHAGRSKTLAQALLEGEAREKRRSTGL
jgi:hypothetical protein